MSSEEKTLVINLKRVYDGRKAQRAARAIRKLRELIAKRTHAEVVKIDEEVNQTIWMRGIEKPPRKLKLKIIVEEKREIKTSKGETKTLPKIVRVTLPETKERVEEKPEATKH